MHKPLLKTLSHLWQYEYDAMSLVCLFLDIFPRFLCRTSISFIRPVQRCSVGLTGLQMGHSRTAWSQSHSFVILAVWFSLCFIRPDTSVSRGLSPSGDTLANLGCHVPLTKEQLLSGHFRADWRLSSLHKVTPELCQRDHRVLGHLPD